MVKQMTAALDKHWALIRSAGCQFDMYALALSNPFATRDEWQQDWTMLIDLDQRCPIGFPR